MKRLDQKFHPCNLLGDIEDYTHVIRKQSTIYSGVSYGQSLDIGISAHFHIFWISMIFIGIGSLKLFRTA